MGPIKESSPPIPVTGNGVYQSPTFKIMGAAGTYAFQAVYSGDAQNAKVTSACEPFHVPGMLLILLLIHGHVIRRKTLSQTKTVLL